MTTQYTPILKLALPVTGELSGTWGDVVNDNITSMVEQAIAGLATISTWSANSHTLTTANGTTSESRCAMLVAQNGAGLAAAGEIVCPASSKLYVLKNDTSYAITLKTAAGTGVAVASGNTAFLFCDGTNVNACVTTIVDGRVTGNLTVDGNATVNGNTTLGNATSDTITATARFASGLTPSADNTYDLGSTGNSWKDLYIDGTAYLALVDINGGTIDGVSIGASTAATIINVDNLRLDGNTISSTDTNGNVVIAPNGTGDVQLDADTVRVGDSGAAATLTSNGAGALTVTTGGAANLVLSTNSGTDSGTITIANGANGNISIVPNGTGDVQLDADTVRIGDANTDVTLTSNGTGNLNLSTNGGTNSGTIQIAQGANASISLTPNGTGTTVIKNPSISGTTTFNDGNANQVIYLNASKQATTSANLTFDGTTLTAANFADSSLTSGRVTYAGASGNLTDSANLTFDGTTLTANALTVTNATTLSAGTANGVAYLNGSKVLTTGSALTFDGTALVNTRNTTDGSAAALTLNNSGATASYATLNLNAGSVTYQQFADAAGNAIGTAGVMFRTTSNHPMVWATNNTERARLTAGGDFLVATTTNANNARSVISAYNTSRPALEVQADFDRPGISFNGGPLIRSDGKYAVLRTPVVTSGDNSLYFETGTGGDGNITFIANGLTRGSLLGSNGNLLLDNTSPISDANLKVQLNVTSGNTQRFFAVNNNGGYGLIMGFLYNDQANIRTVGAYPLVLGTNNGERLRITSAGYVGVGTSNPGTTLDVAAGTNPGLRVTQTYTFGGTNYAIAVPGNGSTGGYISQNPAAGGIVVADGMTYYGGGPWRPDGTSAESIQMLGGNVIFTTNTGLTGGVNFTPTERMRLNGDGALLVNTTTANGDYVKYAMNGATMSLGVNTTGSESSLMNAGAINNVLLLRAPFGANPEGGTNANAKWGIMFWGASPVEPTYPFNTSQARSTSFGKNAAIYAYSDETNAGYNRAVGLQFWTTNGIDGNAVERVRINRDGNVIIGDTSGAARLSVFGNGTSNYNAQFNQTVTNNNVVLIAGDANSNAQNYIVFARAGTATGTVYFNGSTVAYNTTSDYRLKTVIGGVSGSGERIDALEPVEYEWKHNGVRTRGFLAHKFQEVYSQSVSGTKDAVDAKGNPVYQSMQASTAEVIADLVAEIQSLRKRLAAAGIA